MSGADLTALDKVLKEVYVPAVREQMQKSTVLMSNIERTSEFVDGTGKFAVVPLKLGFSEAIGARNENELLPTESSTRYDRLEVPMRTNYGTIYITGHAIRQTKTDSGAFIRAVDSEMSNMVDALKRDINRQYFGDGTGALATVTVNALSGDSAVVVDSVQYIKKGQVIDIYESSSEVVDSKTVLSVDSATLTVTFTATLGAGVTAANSPKVKRHLAHNKEIQGLKLIVAQGTYILVPATVPEWTANLVTLPGSYTDAQILEYIQKAYTASEKADEPPTFAITTYELRDKYANTLTTLRRIVDTMDLKFGFKALKFNDVGIAADDQAPEGFFAWINTKKLVMNHVTDFDWADEDGKILDKVPGYDAYRAYMVYAGNLAASRRNSHTLLNGW